MDPTSLQGKKTTTMNLLSDTAGTNNEHSTCSRHGKLTQRIRNERVATGTVDHNLHCYCWLDRSELAFVAQSEKRRSEDSTSQENLKIEATTDVAYKMPA